MADFSALKTAIQANIRTNGNEEITGAILQDILLSMVTTMGDGAINAIANDLAVEVVARQNAVGGEATTRAEADSQLSGRINAEAQTRGEADTQLSNSITAITTRLNEGYVYAGIATPSTNPGTPAGKVFYIALQAGTYTNFSSLAVTQGITILKYNGTAWSQEQLVAIDDIPTDGSDDLVKSGGVYGFASAQRYVFEGNGSGDADTHKIKMVKGCTYAINIDKASWDCTSILEQEAIFYVGYNNGSNTVLIAQNKNSVQTTEFIITAVEADYYYIGFRGDVGQTINMSVRQIDTPVIQFANDLKKGMYIVGGLRGASYPYTPHADTDRILSVEILFKKGTIISVPSDYKFVFCGHIHYNGWTTSYEVIETQIAQIMVQRANETNISVYDVLSVASNISLTYNNAIDDDNFFPLKLFRNYHTIDWVIGSLAVTSWSVPYAYRETSDNTRARTVEFSVKAYTRFKCINPSYKFGIYGINELQLMSAYDKMVVFDQNVRILMAKTDDSVITPTDLENMRKSIVCYSEESIFGEVVTPITKSDFKDIDFRIGKLSLALVPDVSDTTRMLSVAYNFIEGTRIDCVGYKFVFIGDVYQGWTKSFVVPSTQTAHLLMAKDNDAVITEADIHSMVSSLNISFEHVLPAYYETEIQEKVDTTTDDAVNGSVNYVLITDPHIDSSNNQMIVAPREMEAVVDIANKGNVDFVVVNGDLIMGIKQTAIESLALVKKMTQVLTKCHKPVFITKGNHDYNSFVNIATEDLTMENLISDAQWYANVNGIFPIINRGTHDVNNPNSTYMYYDIEDKKTRLVFLDTSDWQDNMSLVRQNGSAYFGLSNDQVEWFANQVLTKSEEGWQYLIFGHVPMNIKYTCFGIIPDNCDIINGFINALNNRTSYTGGGITKNFSIFKSKVKLYHYGHVEGDIMGMDELTGMMYVCTRNAIVMSRQLTYADIGLDSSTYPQETYGEDYTIPAIGNLGDISEAAFDVVSVEPTKVQCYRFGNGNDRQLSFQ